MEQQDLSTDLELVEKVKSGERLAFSDLVKRHQKGLMRLSLRFVKDFDQAEDVVQESFIKAYERLNSFEARASFKSWLFQIAVNTAKNKLRDKKNDSVDFETVQVSCSATAEKDLLKTAVGNLIQKHVDMLPQKQRTALVLRVYEDLSFKEIAEIMECPYDTAKANYRHALLKLKEELETDNDLRNYTEDDVVLLTRRVAEVER